MRACLGAAVMSGESAYDGAELPAAEWVVYSVVAVTSATVKQCTRSGYGIERFSSVGSEAQKRASRV